MAGNANDFRRSKQLLGAPVREIAMRCRSFVSAGLCIIASLAIASSAWAQTAQPEGVDRVDVQIDSLPTPQRELLLQKLKQASPPPSGETLRVGRQDLADAINSLKRGPWDINWIQLSPAMGPDVSHVQRVYPTESVRATIGFRIKAMRNECIEKSKSQAARDACYQAKEIAKFDAMLAALTSATTDCDDASAEYRELLDVCDPDCDGQGSDVKRRFDNACLSSSLSWKRADGESRADPEPPVLRTGGARSGTAGIIDALVLIELHEDGGREHLCGGLLLDGNRILTAQHCFGTPRARSALEEGMARVRLVRESDDKSYRLLASSEISQEKLIPAQDFVVLRFASSLPVPAPRVEFRRPSAPAPAVVFGYFRDFDRARVLQGSGLAGGISVPTWKQALRWNKPGLCYVVETVDDCVRTLCQTVRGYSGTPIFSTESTSAGPLVVYGVISTPDYVDAECGETDVYTTLAASASTVTP